MTTTPARPTIFVAFGEATRGDDRAQILSPPAFIFVEGGRASMSKADKAIEVYYDGPARRVVDRLIRRQELKKVSAPTPKEK